MTAALFALFGPFQHPPIGSRTIPLRDHGRFLDEVRLWLHPVLVGLDESEDELGSTAFQPTMRLTDPRPLKSGIVILTYRPLAKET